MSSRTARSDPRKPAPSSGRWAYHATATQSRKTRRRLGDRRARAEGNLLGPRVPHHGPPTPMLEHFQPLIDAASGVDLTDPRRPRRAEEPPRPRVEAGRAVSAALVALLEEGRVADRGAPPVRFSRAAKPPRRPRASPSTWSTRRVPAPCTVTRTARSTGASPSRELRRSTAKAPAGSWEPPGSEHVPTVEGGRVADRVPPPRGRDRVRSGLKRPRARSAHCGRRVHSVTSPVGAFFLYPKRCSKRAIHRGAPRRARIRPARASSERTPGSSRSACSIHDLRSSREANSHGRPTARQRKKPSVPSPW